MAGVWARGGFHSAEVFITGFRVSGVHTDLSICQVQAWTCTVSRDLI